MFVALALGGELVTAPTKGKGLVCGRWQYSYTTILLLLSLIMVCMTKEELLDVGDWYREERDGWASEEIDEVARSSTYMLPCSHVHVGVLGGCTAVVVQTTDPQSSTELRFWGRKHARSLCHGEESTRT